MWPYTYEAYPVGAMALPPRLAWSARAPSGDPRASSEGTSPSSGPVDRGLKRQPPTHDPARNVAPRTSDLGDPTPPSSGHEQC